MLCELVDQSYDNCKSDLTADKYILLFIMVYFDISEHWTVLLQSLHKLDESVPGEYLHWHDPNILFMG